LRSRACSRAILSARQQRPGGPSSLYPTASFCQAQQQSKAQVPEFLQTTKSVPTSTSTKAFEIGSAHRPLKAPVKIRGRAGLPEADHADFIDSLQAAGPSFPLIGDFRDAASSPEDAGAAARAFLDEHLVTSGAVVLRNLPFSSSAEFSRFVQAIGWRTHHLGSLLQAMQGRSMCSRPLDSNVRTASDEPPIYTIEPHSEFHTAGFPHKIMLFCSQPAATGGEWPVGNIRAIEANLPVAVKDKLVKHGVRYSVHYPSEENAHYNHWQGNLGPSRPDVEEYLTRLEYEFEWCDDDGSITYWKTLPAYQPHPTTGEMVWFNQIHAHHWTFYASHPAFSATKWDESCRARFPVDVSYGDGTPIDTATINVIRNVVWRHTVAVAMQPGDLLVCDNYQAMHGRMSFGNDDTREVFVSAIYE